MQTGRDEDSVNPYILAAATRLEFLTDGEAKFLCTARRARGLVERGKETQHPGQLSRLRDGTRPRVHVTPGTPWS